VATYSFVSAWKISASPETVWEYIGDPLRWQLFWPGLEDVKLLGDASSSGAEAYEFVFKSFLPFRVALEGRVTSKQAPRRLVMKTQASSRERGRSICRIRGMGSLTHR